MHLKVMTLTRKFRETGTSTNTRTPNSYSGDYINASGLDKNTCTFLWYAIQQFILTWKKSYKHLMAKLVL